MAIKSYDELSFIQRDALREIGNIGTGNAVASLALMLGNPINITAPNLEILDYQTAIAKLGGPEQLMVGILVFLKGDVTGMIMFMLHQEFANQMLITLTGADLDETGVVDELGLSAIQEIGNIMAASYINAIVEMTGLTIDISPPSTCIDMVGSMMSTPEIYYADISDKIISIENNFTHEGSTAPGNIMLIPEVDALQKIMESLSLGDL